MVLVSAKKHSLSIPYMMRIQRFVKNGMDISPLLMGLTLMAEIGKTMYGDAVRPGLTADQLKKRYDKRAQTYNQQWEEPDKKPGISGSPSRNK